MKFTIEEFLSKLPQPANETWKDGVYFTTAFRREGVSLEFFAPRGTDYQTSHDEDEFYFIVRGSGELIVENDRFTCAVGDAFLCQNGFSITSRTSPLTSQRGQFSFKGYLAQM